MNQTTDSRMTYSRVGMGMAALRLDDHDVGQVNAAETKDACALAEKIALRWNLHPEMLALLHEWDEILMGEEDPEYPSALAFRVRAAIDKAEGRA